MHAIVTWVEIPVSDFDRAKTFYEKLLGSELTNTNHSAQRRAVTLPHPEGGPGVSITETAGFTPHSDGVLVYLDAGADLDSVLAQAVAAGAEVVIPKTAMGEVEEFGYFATFKDTEGNTLALYANK